jgi:hypothetical protein
MVPPLTVNTGVGRERIIYQNVGSIFAKRQFR